MAGELFDGQILGLVVGQAQLAVGGGEGVLDLLQVGDGLVDLVDGLLEALTGLLVIVGKFGLEIVHFVFKVGDVDVLLPDEGQFLFGFDRVHGGVAKQGDHGNKKLGPDDVHLFISIRNVHDAGVVQFAVRFQQRDQHGVFAVLFPPVPVQLPEEVFVLVLAGGGVHLVFHFKHDGQDFRAVLRALPENEVPLAAGAGVVVLVEIGVGEGGHTDAVELRQTMLLQAFAHHLGGLPCLEIPVLGDLLVLQGQLGLVPLQEKMLLVRPVVLLVLQGAL